MVRFWEVQREAAIKRTKFRIKHHEKHGEGNNAMQDKAILKKQERHHELMKEKLKK